MGARFPKRPGWGARDLEAGLIEFEVRMGGKARAAEASTLFGDKKKAMADATALFRFSRRIFSIHPAYEQEPVSFLKDYGFAHPSVCGHRADGLFSGSFRTLLNIKSP
jgi:hypothetical protein